MTMSVDHAKSVLRLPLDAALEPSKVNMAFHKMARRYPVEQFPERFSEIRNAYELLTNPMSEIRSLLLGENPDLESIFPMPPCLNKPPSSETAAKLLRQLAIVLRYGVPILNECNDFDDFFHEFDDEVDDEFDFDVMLHEMEKMLSGDKKSHKKSKSKK